MARPQRMREVIVFSKAQFSKKISQDIRKKHTKITQKDKQGKKTYSKK